MNDERARGAALPPGPEVNFPFGRFGIVACHCHVQQRDNEASLDEKKYTAKHIENMLV